MKPKLKLMASDPGPGAAALPLPRRLPHLAALCTSVAGVLVLIGWRLDVVALKSLSGGFVAMNPATAAGFILAGGSLGLLAAEPTGGRRWTYVVGRCDFEPARAAADAPQAEARAPASLRLAH